MNQPGTTSNEPHKGRMLGKYRVKGRLGQGGMGTVYEAEDSLLKRQVAIKILPRTVSSDPQALQRFLLEAQAAARLNHPNVVAIYEVDQREGAYFIVMELVRGGSAQDRLNKCGPFAWQEATRVVADACRGMVAAHAAGLIHRDIKPANIMVAVNGVVKLADFGLAKAVDQSVSGITGAGYVVGTPSFMSPEQCRCERLDDRSDLYSLGATYYALLTGKPPYEGTGPMEVMFAHCSNPIPDPRALNPAIPEGCAAIVRRALAKLPGQRFATAVEMLAALEAPTSYGLASEQMEKTECIRPVKLMKPESIRPPRDAGPLAWIPKRRSGLLWAAAALCLLLLVGFAATWLLHRPNSAGSLAVPASATRLNSGLDQARGKRQVLLVIAHENFWYAEFQRVREVLDQEKDIQVITASSEAGPARPVLVSGWQGGEVKPVTPDRLIQDVRAADYDALILCGGYLENVRPLGSATTSVGRKIRDLIQEMHQAGRLVTALCMGTVILADAGLLQGKRATEFSQVRRELELGGAQVVNEPIVEEGTIITGRDP